MFISFKVVLLNNLTLFTFRQLRSSMLCMKVHMMPCGEAEKKQINGAWDYVRTIVGDRCPLIMAATTCNVDAQAAVNPVCNVTRATHCGMDVINLYKTTRDINTVCRSVPCFYYLKIYL